MNVLLKLDSIANQVYFIHDLTNEKLVWGEAHTDVWD